MTTYPMYSSKPILVSIGSIHCTEDTVMTPVGQAPIKATEWNATNTAVTRDRIPTWAIVVAIITATFTCLLGLLFLLVKEPHTEGMVSVTVRGDGLYFTEAIPVVSPYQVTDLLSRVEYARSLAAS